MGRFLLFLSLIWLVSCGSTAGVEVEELPTEITAAPLPSSTPIPTMTAAEDLPTAMAESHASATQTPEAAIESRPVRIVFELGAPTTTIEGHAREGASSEYLFTASAGQHAHIEIVSQNNVANFAIEGLEDGQPYKRVENENRYWDGTLPESQDYLIRVRALEDADYTLIVTLDPSGTNVLQPVWPLVDGTSGFLLGGSYNGQWLDAVAIMPSLQDAGRPYQLYSNSGYEGEITGSPPVLPQTGPCGSLPVVSFEGDQDPSGMMALVARWEAAPRKSQSLPLENSIYQQEIARILQEQGLISPDVRLTGLEKIDLEGDGLDEVLITANNLTGLEGGLPMAAAGDYSLVLLRKVAGDEVISEPIGLTVFTEDVELAYPVQYNLLAVLDLNGDGKLEVVIEGISYEGRFVSVYESTGQGMEVVLSVGCRL